MVYTQTQKAEWVRLYLEVGPDEASAKVGCSRRQGYRWLGSHGVSPKTTDEQRAETEARHAERRAELRDLLLDQAIDALHRMNEMHVEYRMVAGRDEEIVYQKAAPNDWKSYATAAAILIDKYRLEMGEATARTYHEGTDDIDRRVAQLVGEMGRRAEAEASRGPVDSTST